MPRQRLHILLVDDDEDDLFLINHYLSGVDTFDVSIDQESNYDKALAKVLKGEHDIYIVDYLLGKQTGLQMLKEAVATGIDKPFILLTGKGDQKIDLEATRSGAYDYITKSDLNTESLERCLRYSYQRYLSYKIVAESEKRYRTIFTKSNDIIFVLDEQLGFVDFNPAMKKLLGYTTEELIGQPLKKIFSRAEDVELLLNRSKDQFNEKDSDAQFGLITKDGERRVFLASISEMSSVGDKIHYQGILHDYTAMKKSLEDQLLREKLETTGRVVRSLAHEIRNPLTNINLSAHELIASEDKELFIDIIKRNSKRINDLITELMNLSNPLDNKFERIDLNEIIRSALTQSKDRIELKKITVLENLSSKPLSILGDREKILTALVNIIINAVEAIENKKGILAVDSYTENGKAFVRIKDNGAGITAENLPYLFQPYFTQKKNGMGFGLTNTYAVIRAHNGNIEVESKEGAGAAFTVSLEKV